MKKFFVLLLSIMMIMSLFACGNSSSGQGTEEPTETGDLDLPEISFNYSSNFPETHRVSKLDQAWFEELEEKANIKITPYWSNSLTSAASPYTETANGVSDITHIAPGNEKDHFVIENAVGFFFYGTKNKEVLYNAAVDLFESTPEWQAEYEGVKVLWLGSMGDLFAFTKEEITDVQDLKGAAIRCTEDQAYQLVEKMGGTAVRMPVSELYESLEKGTVQGIINGTNTIEQYQLGDLLGYALDLGLSGSFAVHAFINEDSWNKLTPDQQDILMETCKERALAQMVAIDEWTQLSGDYCRDLGMVFKTLSDEDQAKLDAFYEEMAQIKIQELNDAGYDGQAIFDRARSLVEKYNEQFN